jgi:predicted transcriptional regulator
VLKRRVEVLFEPSEYRRLEEIARVERRSVGAVVREAVGKYVLRPTEEERKKAIEWFAAQSAGPVGSPQEIKEEILRARDEALAKSLETD